MTNPETLKAQLKIIPPDSKIELTWKATELTQTEGRIVDYNPYSAARRIETESRTLLVTPSVDESELTVCELTAEQPRSLGELQKVTLIDHAIETLEITPKGVDVPSYLVGYSGFLVIETNEKNHELRIPDPGLEAYDDRLVAYCSDNSPIRIRPRSGPHRQYEVLDNRTTNEPTVENPPGGDYEGLDELINTIVALADTVSDDDELTDTLRTKAGRKLHELHSPLLAARQILFNPDQDTDIDTDWQPTAEYAADISESNSDSEFKSNPGSEYLPTLEYLTTELDRFEAIGQHETGSLAQQLVDLKFSHASSTVDELYGLLCSTERSVPSRDDTEGRGATDGRWLERQLRNALQRWGYSADVRTHVYGVEVDVIARRHDKQDDPTDWIVAQCKDWENRVITPHVIFRLCMLAFTCKAMPVLCHTTTLTDRAREIAERWEVRVLGLDDLHRGALPAPNTLRLSEDLCSYATAYTARDKRGRLPGLIWGEKDRHFTYVPGYEPVGRTYEYRPVKREDKSE